MDDRTLKALIGEMDKGKLIDMIGCLVRSNSVAEQALLVFCQKESPPMHRGLAEGKLLINLWRDALLIIHGANTLGGCSDEEEIDAFSELDDITTLIQKHHIPWEYRRVVVDEMLVQIGYDNSGFTDRLVDVAEVLCQTEDEKRHLAERLALCGNSYYKKYAATILRSIGDLGRALEIRKENLEYGVDYLDLAGYQDELGDHDAALETALEGLEQGTGRLDGLYRYVFDRYQKNRDEKSIQSLYDTASKKKRDLDCIAELMYRHFMQKGDYPNQKRMLLELMEACRNDAVKKWYDQCMKDFTALDWQKEEAFLLQIVKRKNTTAYMDICLENGNREEVLKCIMHGQSDYSWSQIDAGHRYSRHLVEYYPNEILKLYWMEVHSLIQRGNDREYRTAASVLKEIKAIMGKQKRNDEWLREIAALKDTHRRKRNFLREIVGF